MIQNVLHHLGGVANYGIISLCLFFLIFGCSIVYTLRLRKSHLERMSQMPLESETESLNSDISSHE